MLPRYTEISYCDIAFRDLEEFNGEDRFPPPASCPIIAARYFGPKLQHGGKLQLQIKHALNCINDEN